MELDQHQPTVDQAAVTPPPVDKGNDEVKRLQRELKDTRVRLSQSEQSAKEWYDRATTAGRPAPKEEPATEAEPEIDIIDVLTSQGSKGLAAALDKMGYAKRADVDKNIDTKIGQTRAQINQEVQLYNKYPDLQDEDSDFYLATLEIYKELSEDPVMAKSSALVEKAAKIADRQGGKPQARRAAPAADDDDDSAEADRVARVGRQSAGGRGGSRREPEEDSTGFDRMASSIVERFNREGAKLTVEGLKKRMDRGVTVTNRSMPRRQAR